MWVNLTVLYLLFWGAGLYLDPRLSEYKFLGTLGLVLIIGASIYFYIFQGSRPLEFRDSNLDAGLERGRQFFEKPYVVVFCLLVGIACAAYIITR